MMNTNMRQMRTSPAPDVDTNPQALPSPFERRQAERLKQDIDIPTQPPASIDRRQPERKVPDEMQNDKEPDPEGQRNE